MGSAGNVPTKSGNTSWQIDQDDVRIVSQLVEHNLLAVGCDVERPHVPVIAQAGEGPALSGLQVEEPEILDGPSPCI